MKPTPSVLVLALGLAAIAAPRAAADDPFPLLGEVTCQDHGGLSVRSGPPSVSAFRYRLGPILCGIGNGSRFTAFEQHLVANGEVWFQVEVTAVTRSLGSGTCPPTPFSGWMLARSGNQPMVRVLARNVVATAAPPSQPLATPGADTVSSQPEKNPSVLAFLAKYLLLVLGTLVGVAVIAMERSGSLKRRDWLTAVTYLEGTVLSAANVLFLVLLVNAKYVSSGSVGSSATSDPLFAMVRLFEASAGGFLVLGFVLTAIWMKFMSFAAHH